MASPLVWDSLVRQAVLWLGKNALDLGDPAACIEIAKQEEPERQKLATFLTTVAAIDPRVPGASLISSTLRVAIPSTPAA